LRILRDYKHDLHDEPKKVLMTSVEIFNQDLFE